MNNGFDMGIENNPNLINSGTQNAEGLLSKGSQFQERNDMMSAANLEQAA